MEIVDLSFGLTAPWHSAWGIGRIERLRYRRRMVSFVSEPLVLRRSRLAQGSAAVLFMLLPATAEAAFTVCNQSFDVVNVAVGHDTAGPSATEALFVTEGWWTIGPNQCANVIREPLTTRYIYVHAQDVFGQPVLPGSRDMCVEPKKFRVEGIEDCWARGLVTAQFQQVDTQTTERWTLFLSPTP